jgi:hypothetical protein
MSKINMDFDFGFSAVTEDELKQYEKQQINDLSNQHQAVALDAKAYKDKLNMMHAMILPLIANLSKDPQKEYILWPGRDKKLAEFKKKLDALIND